MYHFQLYYYEQTRMRFLTVLMFSTLIMSMILIIIDGFSTDSHSLYNNNNNNYNNSIDVMRDARVELLKVKRWQGDGPTILAYIIIAAAIIVPNIPQID